MDLAQCPPYDTIDFRELAKKDNDFKQTWQKSKGHLDFQDPATVKALSKARLWLAA
jgi:23S rRNA (adenine1618-N6)-methyltransferase